MRAIYRPKGAALEYAPLACNMFTGCLHGCTYCYVPRVLRTDRAAFHAHQEERPGVLNQLARDVVKIPHGSGPVLLCFTSDPLPEDHRLIEVTRRAVTIIRDHGHPVTILTKAPQRLPAGLASSACSGLTLGVTITSLDVAATKTREPGAPSPEARWESLLAHHRAGMKCWVSCEPVIEPQESMGFLRRFAATEETRGIEIRIGKINRHEERRMVYSWADFCLEAAEVLRDRQVFVKASLREHWPTRSP